jgi:hypothetical protein
MELQGIQMYEVSMQRDNLNDKYARWRALARPLRDETVAAGVGGSYGAVRSAAGMRATYCATYACFSVCAIL